jgi:hypothetical protein
MVRYYLEASCGYAEYKAKLDIEQIKKEYEHRMSMFKEFGWPRYPDYMFEILVSFALDYGKMKTDISPRVGDYDPYLTEIYASQEDMDELKKNFPDADYDNIEIE